MGRANVYIRIEHEAIWANIDNKSDWINTMLGQLEDRPPLEKADEQTSTTENEPEKLSAASTMQFCPEGHAVPPFRTHCLGKGCKYA